MKLNNIHLRNYRNFRDYSISFASETTVFIGKNGMGKTNLISGIKQSLSFIFSKKKDEVQYEFIASSDQKVESFSASDALYAYKDNNQGDYSYPISIMANATDKAKEINWEFYKENLSSGFKDTLYRTANEIYWTNYYIDRNIGIGLPVFAFFSDSYPHVSTNLGNKIQNMLDSGNPLPRNTGYYKWDEEKNCTEIWMQYFTMQWKNYKFGNEKGDKGYLDAINAIMKNFSATMSKAINSNDIEITGLEVETRGKDDILIIVFKNGSRIPFMQLPQGYKRMFSIVFDISNRSYLLNSNCSPSGIVMIDEIELHLHPSIAQEILNGLKKSFPDLQLIISTHSPLVITNLKQDEKNIIYKLYSENDEYKNERVEDLYGLDYNSGLIYSMNTPYRKSKIDELVKAYEYWRNADNSSMAEQLKSKIKDAVGENSNLYQSLD
jgi:predicted ATP-binding protein involved in virulence